MSITRSSLTKGLTFALSLAVLREGEAQVRTGNPAPARSTVVLAREASPSVALVSGTTSDNRAIVGSAFVVDPTGVLVTNLHVIRGVTKLSIKLPNGDSYDRVSVKAYDEAKDIAVIKVPAFNLKALPLGNSDLVEQGSTVVLIGSPIGLEGTVSTGVISAIRQLDGFRVFQTDAAANPGNSGGPMINERGEVVGVLTFGIKASQNLNFAVPVNYARGLMSIDDGLSLAQLNDRLGPSAATVVAETSPPRVDPPPPALPASTATAIVLRVAEYDGKGRASLTTLNGAELARLRNDQYFSFEVVPGTYELRSTCKRTVAPFKAEAGKVYYFAVQIDRRCGGLMLPFTATEVAADYATQWLPRLKPVEARDILHVAVRRQ